MANITGWGRGTWGEGAWNAPLAVEVTGVAGTTALGNETVTAGASAVIDFRDSLMATSFSQEFGLTVDGFVNDGQTIGNGSDTEDITDTERAQDIVLAAEMDLPSSFSKASCIWECGGTGSGAWFGISEQSGAYFLRFRAGDGSTSSNTTSNSLSIAQVAVSTLPQFFDGNTHTVVWAIDRSIGKTEIYIDGQLVAEGQTSDGSSVAWAGSATGGFGTGNGTPAGGDSDDGSTQLQSSDDFTGTIRSDLRMYKNEFIATQTNSTQTGTAKVIPTGAQGSGQIGDEVTRPQGIFGVTGVQATGAIGLFEAAGQTIISPTAAGATGAVGNTVETGGAKVTTTGVAGTSALGDEGTTAGSLVVETGLSGTSALGTVIALPSIEPVPTGVSATGGIGTVLAAGGAKVVEDAITGTVNLGDEAVSAGANVSVTGVNATGGLDTDSTLVTFIVTVVGGNPSDHPYYNQGSTNKYAIGGSTASADVVLTLIEGRTYRFDQSDSSNSGHPIAIYEDANKTTQYTSGVTTNGTAGTAGAYTEITVPIGAPTLFYQCTNHALMGAQLNTDSATGTVVTGGAGVSPTTVAGTTALGEETIDLTLIVSTTGVSATDGIGTLAIVPECVVSLTGISATGATGEEIIYSLIIPNQTANWIETAA